MFQYQLLSLSLALVLLSGCAPAAQPTDQAPAPVLDDGLVVAEGRLEPDEHTVLSFATGGQVAEILVAEGERVEAGQELARLTNRESLLSSVAQAEQGVLDAQEALDALRENAALERAQIAQQLAQTNKDLDRAQRTLRNTQSPDIAYYEDQLTRAEEAYQTAVENQEIATLTDVADGLRAAQDRYDVANNVLNDVRAELQKYPGADRVFSAAAGTFVKPEDAQREFDEASESLRAWQLRYEQAQRGNAQVVEDLQEQVDDAQANLDRARDPRDLDIQIARADVDLLTARAADLQTRLDKLADGPDPDQLALAEARLAAAQSSLAAATVALSNAIIVAPIAGTVADVRLKIGEQIGPGAPAVIVAGFEHWVVRTNNLTESQVVDIAVGQAATVTLDALLDEPLTGRVRSISDTFVDNRGDVTYEVVIELTAVPARARWGMTAQVNIVP
jgi:multidrug resistance efflux pump